MIISSSFSYLFFHWRCFNVPLFRQCSIVVLRCSAVFPLFRWISVIPALFRRSAGVSCSGGVPLFRCSAGVPCSVFWCSWFYSMPFHDMPQKAASKQKSHLTVRTKPQQPIFLPDQRKKISMPWTTETTILFFDSQQNDGNML